MQKGPVGGKWRRLWGAGGSPGGLRELGGRHRGLVWEMGAGRAQGSGRGSQKRELMRAGLGGSPPKPLLVGPPHGVGPRPGVPQGQSLLSLACF